MPSHEAIASPEEEPSPFDEFIARSDAAMVVVTAVLDEVLYGCLVGFHCQASIDPVRYGVFLSHENATYRAAGSAAQLAVHLLGEDDIALASIFGGTTADDGVDKFDWCRWRRVDDGPPIIEGAVAWFVGDIVDRVPAGDHTAHLLEPRTGGVEDRPRRPLRYGAVRDLPAGH